MPFCRLAAHRLAGSVFCCVFALASLTSFSCLAASPAWQAPESSATQDDQPSQEEPVVEEKPMAKEEPTAEENGGEPKAQSKAEDKSKKAAPETTEITSESLRDVSVLKGILESTDATEVKVDIEKWSDLKISKVVDQGAVSTGDIILEFDTETIDKAIVEAEFALKAAEFAHQLAELESKSAKQSVEQDMELAKHDWKVAQEDYEYYKSVTVPERQIDLEFSEKSAGYYLEYAKDELDQLTQMYTEDELTEESEAIVLKRAQRSVESSARSRDRSMIRIARSRKFEHPRRDTSEEADLRRAKLSFDRDSVRLPIDLEKANVKLAKAAFELEEKKKSLDQLKSDREKMAIRAPATGVLYYGKSDRGKWKSPGKGSSKALEIDQKIDAKSIVMTIIDPSELIVRCNIEEESLSDFKTELVGKAKFAAIGEEIVPVAIEAIAQFPLADGKFDCKVKLQNVPLTARPGMSCKAAFLVYEKADALVAPKASVHSDDEGFTNYVYTLGDDDDPVKTEVKTGRTIDKKVEILAGLSKGDKILKKKPE